MKVSNTDIVFLSGVRTAFGSFGGSLKGHSATDLGVIASKAAMERAGVEPGDVDHVVFGNVQQTSGDAIYLARHIGLKAGVPTDKPGLTVNRLCGSGFQSLVNGGQQILLGESDVVLAGGTENMSQAPHVARKMRWGMRFGQDEALKDSLWEALYDPYADLKMGETAERLGEQYGVTRQECDEYGFRSHQAWKAAHDAGRFDDEIVPVMVKKRREMVEFKVDEHPRPDVDLAKMSRLPTVFKKDGLVSAANASGICDGGAAMVMANGDWASKKGLQPIARLVGWGISGCDPKIMGIGPAPAARKALADCGMTLDDLDLVEVNEAFAPQYLAVEKELGLDRDKVNVNGGAIAIGHPLACSGTRITLTLIHELRRRGGRFGLGSACIGGGQGIAVIVEAL